MFKLFLLGLLAAFTAVGATTLLSTEFCCNMAVGRNAAGVLIIGCDGNCSLDGGGVCTYSTATYPDDTTLGKCFCVTGGGSKPVGCTESVNLSANPHTWSCRPTATCCAADEVCVFSDPYSLPTPSDLINPCACGGG